MVTCDPSTVTLTPRQRDVLRLVAEGYCNKTIARLMGITMHTVKCHLVSIYNVLGIDLPTSGVSIKRAVLTRMYLLSWAWCEFPVSYLVTDFGVYRHQQDRFTEMKYV